jgi:hypothetical protein
VNDNKIVRLILKMMMPEVIGIEKDNSVCFILFFVVK